LVDCWVPPPLPLFSPPLPAPTIATAPGCQCHWQRRRLWQWLRGKRWQWRRPSV
jgi:hypothetical protein